MVMKMKAGISILFFLFFIPLSVNAQMFAVEAGYVPNPYLVHPQADWQWEKQKTYDTAFIRIRYKMTFWNGEKSERYQDHRLVFIGKNGYRKDVSELLEVMDWKNTPTPYTDKRQAYTYASPVFPATFFVSPQGVSWTLFRTILAGPILRYEENPATFHWILHPETDSLLGYVCQKASMDFKGRRYFAWYCPDIAVNAGPYKFDGLPGLILKMEDTAADYVWEAEGIEKVCTPIAEKQFVVQKSTRKQARELLGIMFSQPYRFLSQILGMRVKVLDEYENSRPAGETEFAVTLYYRPIELE